ncbi:MAG: hypothetical protein KJ970_20740 [Candidatus Eisenbacteria bacterium]|uniref:Intracellular proteinase inhibitor BsuPI domain-containing protein n=1 Tax=Eiseniibacteriota bacterium TaxID=2212470 RepID=A0A948W866_UNCEI|nr:hypothetical protein [Candidatus Eisenbacteria bacterium]MBU1947197.1 hypothetical protein [Candidatus Eisenbacteria bacterium]MBU2693354.1 hypothetical protein [Candidatus Eisenbacteria bacterium]
MRKRITHYGTLFQIMGVILLLAGCSSESVPPTESTAGLLIGGVRVPEVVVEGESASVTVWGTSPQGTRAVETLLIQVVNQPTEGPGEEPGEISVSLAADPLSRPIRCGTTFEITGELPVLEPGDYVVEIAGTHRRQMLHVFPREGWIWYRAIGDPRVPDEGLRILQNGRTMAYREGAARLGRIQLGEERLDRIITWFREARFGELNDFYLDEEPPHGRLLEVALHDGEMRKRVLADEALAPEPLKVLAARLSDLISYVLSDMADPHAVVASLSVEPPAGEMGSHRRLKLSLANHGAESVTLTFPTTQLYDLIILRGGPQPADPMLPDPSTPDLLIWNWAHAMEFSQVITTLSLEPGAVRSFEETWEGCSNAGDVADPGGYHLEARIPADIPVPVRPARLVVQSEHPGSGLQARLSIEPVTGPEGSERELTLYVTNSSREPVSITFLSTKQYDFAIEDPRMARPGYLWLWSRGRGFGDVVFTAEWAPGETKSFTEIWDGAMEDGAAMPAGRRYLLNGWLEVEGHPPLVVARPVPFTIERE